MSYTDTSRGWLNTEMRGKLNISDQNTKLQELIVRLKVRTTVEYLLAKGLQKRGNFRRPMKRL
jgi:hypothetical protein